MVQDNKLQNVGFVQFPIIAGDVEGNLHGLCLHLEEMQPVRNSLLVLPELWVTGFHYRRMSVLVGEIPRVFEKLTVLANQFGIYLAGSYPEKNREGKFFNSLFVIGKDGSYGPYRKQQLFPGEEVVFVPETTKPQLLSTPHGNIGAIICYDLRFPGISRSLCQQGAEVLICSALWPKRRIGHWESLLIARAIENQIFVVGCNGVGFNGKIELGGNSLIISPEGVVLSRGDEKQDGAVVELDWSIMTSFRDQFNSVAIKE